MAKLEMDTYVNVEGGEEDPHMYHGLGSDCKSNITRVNLDDSATLRLSCKTGCLLLFLGITLCTVTSTVTVIVYHVTIGSRPPTSPEQETTTAINVSDDLNLRLTSVFKAMVEEKLNSSERQIAFSMCFPHSNLTSDGTPTFTQTILNTGGGYHEATGKFTCPVGGIYSFSTTIRMGESDTSHAYCWFRVNGNEQSYVSIYKGVAYEQASGTMLSKLNVGDIVDLKCTGWEHVHHQKGTTFSGVLITPS